MDKFDLIVIGSGAGMHIVSSSIGEGMRLALVELGPLGGTCLNNGCIPSQDPDLSCRCDPCNSSFKVDWS